MSNSSEFPCFEDFAALNAYVKRVSKFILAAKEHSLLATAMMEKMYPGESGWYSETISAGDVENTVDDWYLNISDDWNAIKSDETMTQSFTNILDGEGEFLESKWNSFYNGFLRISNTLIAKSKKLQKIDLELDDNGYILDELIEKLQSFVSALLKLTHSYQIYPGIFW